MGRKGFTAGIVYLTTISLTLAQPDSVRQLVNGAPDTESKVKLLVEFGTLAGMNDSLGASSSFYQALRLSNSAASENATGEAALGLGHFYLSYYLNDSVRKYVEVASKAFENSGNLQGKANTNVLLSQVFDAEDNRAESIKVLFESLKYFEEVNDSLEVGKVLNRIANSQNYLGYHTDALQHYQRAFDIFTKIGYERGRAIVLSNQAIIYGEEGDEKKSVKNYRRAISIYESIGNQDNLASTYTNIGYSYSQLKQWDSAYYYLNKAVELSETQKNMGILAFAYSHLNSYFNGKGEPGQGLYYGHKGLEIAEIIKNSQLRININNSLSYSYEGIGDYKKALLYHRKYQVLEDSVYNIENSQVIHDMQARYESEKKEKELALKQADIEKQQAMLEEEGTIRMFLVGGLVLVFVAAGFIYRAERLKARAFDKLSLLNEEVLTKNLLIETALGEKEALLKEIHHRVKNNLQVISSILNMQSRASASPEMLSVIQEGQSRVKAMALIHQKLYQTEKLSEIDFIEYAEELLEHLSSIFQGASGKEISRKVTASDIKLDIDVAIPLGLILNELISNAYKYAFEGRERGEISVELKRTSEGNLQLEVADNGNGLPLDFDLERAKSLGLKLVNILTRQLNGQMSFQSVAGAHFSILIQDMKSSPA